MTNQILIYTDGACSGNPGPGGWGAIIPREGALHTASGCEETTTNNIMELTAAIGGIVYVLEHLKGSEHELLVYSDSEYLIKGITTWISNWKRRGWKTSKGEPVKNKALWEYLDNLNESYSIDWKWVRGHNGNEYNEMADALARSALLGAKP